METVELETREFETRKFETRDTRRETRPSKD